MLQHNSNYFTRQRQYKHLRSPNSQPCREKTSASTCLPRDESTRRSCWAIRALISVSKSKVGRLGLGALEGAVKREDGKQTSIYLTHARLSHPKIGEMSRLGLPVPPGFVITTTTCLDFFEAKGKMPASLKEEYIVALAKVEKQTGKKFGDKTNPLLLSVRSGAAVSMPGMMDTVLNLGLNDDIAAALVEATGNKKWVYDCYRRLIQMYQNVVLGKSTDPYEQVIKKVKATKGYKYDMELSGEDWESVVVEFKILSKGSLPSDPHEQLETAIAAVFNSWFTPRAVRYREYNNIEGLLGTACNVQTMVWGKGGVGEGSEGEEEDTM